MPKESYKTITITTSSYKKLKGMADKARRSVSGQTEYLIGEAEVRVNSTSEARRN